MNRRAKKRISQPTDQEILDNWWLQKEFKAVKGSDGVRTLMPNQIEPGVTKTQEACANFHYMPETKFSLSAFLDSVNLSLMDIGVKTRELRDRLVQSQMEACSSLKKEEIEKMFMRQLSRFLVISRGYGWDKKYKAFKVEDVFNGNAAMTVRQWLKEFNEARATISTDESEKSASKQEHASLKRFTELYNRRAYNLAEEDNSLTKTIKRYNCLVIVGKPGVGKTSCVEAVSQSQGFSLQKIDCSQYSSFAEIKKSYSEAVKSQVVDITNSTLNQGNGKINSFFSLSKPVISDQPRRQESKIFILNNIECFLSTKEDSDIVGDRSTLKSMLDFFRASKFPFFIKMSKTSRNMIDSNLIDEFDFIEYTRPCLDQITAHFDMICRIEALDRLPEVRQLARYKDKQSMPDMTYDDLLQDNLNRFELQLSMLTQDTLDCRLAQLPSFKSLRVFTSAFDYNLHGVISQLNYGMQTDCLKGEYLGNSLWSLINRSFVDEYKFKPELTSPQPANKLDASLIAEYPEVLRSMQWTHLKQVGSTCNQMIFAALLKDQPASIRVHSEVEEFLRKRDPMSTIDLLNAQEDVYLSEVSDRVRDGFLKKNFRVQDPEYFNFCQILQLHSENCSTRNFNRLRSQTKG